MCGRTSCCLRPERYECASSYFDPKLEQYRKPLFDTKSCQEFKPSTNIAPTEITPVLVWDVKENSQVLKPMVWGLIPTWADANYSSSKYHTHNCRIESVKESSLYKPQLAQGRRCVVICDGYYEWQTVGAKSKSPAFIYTKQPNGMKVEDVSCWENSSWSLRSGWEGPSLTYMAGLYSVWQSPTKGVVTSYTILTMASASALSWLHHRMPAILSTQEEIQNWLNYEDIDSSEALSNLHQSESLTWHFVSSAVNNSRNKGPDCNKPMDDKKKGSQATLTSWFSRTPPVKRISDSDGNDASSTKMKK